MKRLIITSFAATLLMLQSCAPSFYSPAYQSTPVFKEAAKTQISAGFTGLFKNDIDFALGTGSTAQAAHSFTDKIFASMNLNYTYMGGWSDVSEGKNTGNYFFIEPGIGYSLPLNNGFVFEAIAYVGLGRLNLSYPYTIKNNPGTDGKLKAMPLSFFVQPMIAYQSKSNIFEAVFSMRAGMLHYSGISGSLIMRNAEIRDLMSQQVYLSQRPTHFMVEPAMTLGLGSELFKFQVQLGFNWDATYPQFPREFMWSAIGLKYTF